MMETTISLKVRSQKAIDILKEMESNSLIEFLNAFDVEKSNIENELNEQISNKFRGVFNNEDALSFDNHTKEMRNEWQTT